MILTANWAGVVIVDVAPVVCWVVLALQGIWVVHLHVRDRIASNTERTENEFRKAHVGKRKGG